MTGPWNVIYLWQGARHHAGQYQAKAEALRQLAAMRADKWHAWIEPVRQ